MGLFDFLRKKQNTNDGITKLTNKDDMSNYDLCEIKYKGANDPEKNNVYLLFFKYKDNIDYDVIIEPASSVELEIFKNHCKKYCVSADVMKKLIEYYSMNNNFFNYFKCDDCSIFEWYDESKELWLGQRDLWVFRYVESLNKFTIGDASNSSFGKEYEFDSIMEMLDSFLSGKSI